MSKLRHYVFVRNARRFERHRPEGTFDLYDEMSIRICVKRKKRESQSQQCNVNFSRRTKSANISPSNSQNMDQLDKNFFTVGNKIIKKTDANKKEDVIPVSDYPSQTNRRRRTGAVW